jgi:hypothetical protein
MKLTTYSNFSTINILPIIDIGWEKFYEGGLCHLRIDIGWLKWGISLVLIDK